MVYRILTIAVLSSSLGMVAAYAQEETTGGVTAAPTEEVTKGLLPDETLSIKPLAGVVAYQDPTGNNTGRGALGLGVEWNLMPIFTSAKSPIYLGIGTGLIYSHMGGPTANFFGSNSSDPNAGYEGANLLIIPTDLKLGYAFTDHFRLSAHGGANGVYRSVANASNFGPGSDSSGDLWKYYPNVGFDLDLALGKGVAVSFRPDWTITPDNHLFAGTLGIGIFMG